MTMRAITITLTCLAVLFINTRVNAEDEIDPLAELAALGDAMAEEGPEGGGSIRANRAVDPAVALRKKDKRNLEARVEKVSGGSFPVVAVKLKVSRPAKEGAGASVKRNDALVVIPQFKVSEGKIDMSDEATRRNAGAFYLQRGDKVMVRLGANKKGKVWEAEYIERK